MFANNIIMKKNLLIVLFSTIVVLIFTSFLYNFISINNFYSRIILLVVFNFSLSIGLIRITKLSINKVFFISLFPTLLVDTSVIYTNQSLLPYRFPIMTSFSIIGVFLGLNFNKKKTTFIYILTFSILYVLLTVRYIIPHVFYQIEKRNSEQLKLKPIVNDVHFLDQNRNIVYLDSLLEVKKCTLLDIYFLGCSPCIEKLSALKKIENIVNSSKFQIIMICDGRASSFSSFVKSYKIENKNFLYLFDNDYCLKHLISNSFGYPTEILFKNKGIINIHTGFNVASRDIYIENTINKIKTIIND